MVNRRSGWVARSLPIACRGGERSLRMLCIALSADLLAARERKRRPWPPPFSALQSTAVTPLRWPGSGVLSWTGRSAKAPPPSTPSCLSATIPPPAACHIPAGTRGQDRQEPPPPRPHHRYLRRRNRAPAEPRRPQAARRPSRRIQLGQPLPTSKATSSTSSPDRTAFLAGTTGVAMRGIRPMTEPRPRSSHSRDDVVASCG